MHRGGTMHLSVSVTAMVVLVDWSMEMLSWFSLKVIVGLGYEMKEDLDIYIYTIVFKTVVPFRRPRYRTSHCYSELSGDYWDKLSHPTITDIFAGIHAQAQASEKGIR